MKHVLILVSALAVTACGSTSSGTANSSDNNGQAAANGAAGTTTASSAPATPSATGGSGGGGQVQPGRWESTMQIVRLDGPGVPPQMREAMARPISTSSCMTPERAAHPFDMAMAHNQQRGCTMSNASMADGHISATSTCPDMTATMSGTYSATTLDATAQVHSSRGGHVMDIETHTVSHRTGECNGTEESGGRDDAAGAGPPAPPGANAPAGSGGK